MDVICAEEECCRGMASLILAAAAVVIEKWYYSFYYLLMGYDVRPVKTVRVGVGFGLAQLDSSGA